MIVIHLFDQLDILHETAGTDDYGVVGVDVGAVLWKVVGVAVTLGQLWGGGGLT